MKRAKELRDEWLQGNRPEWSHFPNIPVMYRSKSVYGHRMWTADEEDKFLRCLGRKERMGKKGTFQMVEAWMGEWGFPRSAGALAQRVPKLMKDAEREGETWTERLQRYGRLSQGPILSWLPTVVDGSHGSASSAKGGRGSGGEGGEDSGRTELRIDAEAGSKDSTTTQLVEHEIRKGDASVDDERGAQNGKQTELIREGVADNRGAGLRSQKAVSNGRAKRTRRRTGGAGVVPEVPTDMEDGKRGGEGGEKTKRVVKGETGDGEHELSHMWGEEEDKHLMTLLGLRKMWGFSWEELMIRHRAEGGYNRTVRGGVVRAKRLRQYMQMDGKDWETELLRLGREEVDKREGARGEGGHADELKRGGEGMKENEDKTWRKRGALWGAEEDKLLRQLVAKKKRERCGWADVVEWMRVEGGWHRTAKACQLRWGKIEEEGIQQRVGRRRIRGTGVEKVKGRDEGAEEGKRGGRGKKDVAMVSEDVFYASLSESESDTDSLGAIEISAALGEIKRDG